jgi:hypothetical protein
MSDLLATGAAWLADQLLQHAAQEVTYVRGAESITLQATVGRREVLVETSVGIVERHEQWEFLVRTSDLVFAGVTVEPARGDRIKHVRAGVTHVYEVMPLAGEDAYRPSDPFGNLWRVHAKYVGVE